MQGGGAPGSGLFFEAFNGDLAAVKASLTLQNPAAIVNKPGVKGWTPLLVACSRGHLEVVCELLRHGADIELPSTAGWRPLMVAASEGHPEIVRALLARSPDLHAKNHSQQTALDLVQRKCAPA